VPTTIRDVARASGVHVSTVSRTFSAPHLVNPDTRSRVLAAAESMGYRPNRAARALITGRTGNVGLIVADIANPYFPPMIKAAESQARQRDYHVFVADTNEDPLVEEELVQAMAKQVDGVLLCSPRMANSAIERLAREVPLVVVNRAVADLPAVVMDVAHGAGDAIAHLVELGHREVILLAGPRGSWTNREIRRSAQANARAAGVRLDVLGPNPPTVAGGQEAARRVRDSGATAVLAYNDLMAIGLLEGLHELGVAVPDEISVVGIDDTALSTLVRPRLTTVATPTVAAGRAAVDMLLQQDIAPRTGRTAGAHPASGRRTSVQVILQTTLIPRESTGPAPQRRRGSLPRQQPPAHQEPATGQSTGTVPAAVSTRRLASSAKE
jgi:LacI family transcriptional regulator